MNRFPWLQEIRSTERSHLGHSMIVGLFSNIDHIRTAFHHANLVAEMEVNRSRADLVGEKRIDDDPSALDFAQDYVSGQDHKKAFSCQLSAFSYQRKQGGQEATCQS